MSGRTPGLGHNKKCDQIIALYEKLGDQQNDQN